MILYLESSALLSVYLHEAGRHDVIQGEVERAQLSVSSPLSLVEVRSGLARARFKDNPPRLRQAGYTRALTEFLADWPRFGQIEIEQSLLDFASQITEKHWLRAYDAVQLATALSVQANSTDEVLLATWDHDLAQAAEAEGLSLAHEVTT